MRALLERHAIYVKDETGWTFSTTAASALIMRWLDLVADDFYYQDLLDFLKSPLVMSQMPREERREAVSTLELLIREHNVVSRLAHYLDLARGNDALTCIPFCSKRCMRRAAAGKRGAHCRCAIGSSYLTPPYRSSACWSRWHAILPADKCSTCSRAPSAIGNGVRDLPLRRMASLVKSMLRARHVSRYGHR